MCSLFNFKLMDETAKTISELIAGDYCKTVVIGGKVYVMKAPAIKVIARATKHFSQVDLPDNAKVADLMGVVSGQIGHIVKGLSYLIVGNVPDYELQSKRAVEEMQHGTHEEICVAFQVAIDLIAGRDFFVVASSAVGLATMIVNPGL